MRSILVVEDEIEIARTLRDFLEVAGFELQVVGDGTARSPRCTGTSPTPDLSVTALDESSAMQQRGCTSEYASSTRR
jgi:DNA-binding response OmpR family regulator